jgi:uncharacterized protein
MNGIQAVVEAIRRGDMDQVVALLDQEPDLAGQPTNTGLSLVLFAAYHQQTDIANYLAALNPDLDIFEACVLGNIERVRELVFLDPEITNAFSIDGFQPLGLASFFGNTSVVAYLLTMGAQVNSPSKNDMKVMPLHSGVAGRNMEVVRLLLAAGADVNAAQSEGFTPIHAAAQNGQLEMVRLLLDFGADLFQQTENGKTACDLAIENNHLDIAEYIKDIS